jgi:dTDP-4-dehydrorhamnose reductase
MKIFILGSSGMLGKYVSKYLSQYYNVIDVNRKYVDASTATVPTIGISLLHLGLEKDDIIINCMGAIKPQVDALGDKNAILVNSIFPRTLADFAEELNIRLIHPTTDCVYSGLKGSYDENDKYDVSDVYGMSKALGEPKNCTVIRTSIIGEEVAQSRSLVEWIKSNKNKTVFGFTNHFWNGITCLQFAKICKQMIETNNFWSGTKHIFSNIVTKKELVEIISNVYELNINVTPKETDVMCDRSLSSIYSDYEKLNNLSIEEQIIEMKEFSTILYS